MNKQLVILVDQDGVLADYTKKLLEETAREFPELPVITARDSVHFNTEQQFICSDNIEIFCFLFLYSYKSV